MILEAKKFQKKFPESFQCFFEESVVRRELAENFCFYNVNYDNINGFPNWAQETLKLHEKDKREYLYSLKEFELAKTHDKLWNAAQIQVFFYEIINIFLKMINTGKMHGYMRMYWAKKILEWTSVYFLYIF